ncbi:Imm17 family immunity protein [Clostridium thermarum]|uniref:Imm17 family immunity protein n=1 Tax=Clostridium thermarum TaxID=1716543 RepID=UPI001122ED64
MKIFIFGAAALCLLASAFNWDWFFNNRRACFFVKIFGRNGARIFYVILVFILIYTGFMANLQ